ncbi:alpha/beta fold hydrolase [Haloferacaceae archaeon DSL9]
MKLSSVLGYSLLGAGTIAAANYRLRSAAGALDPALDGDQRGDRWRGIDIAYTEAGDPDAQDLVLLHGINAAGSSGEFREIFTALAEEYHVVAPDLPGFGRSGRPPLSYSAALYEDFVREFLDRFDDPAIVASSLTGAYAVAAAREVSVSKLVLICPTTIAGPEPPKGWLFSLLRSPFVGEALFNAIASKPSIRYFNADHGYYDTDNVSEEWIDYEWRTAHQQNARFAPASFVSGYLNSDLGLGAAIRDLDVPTTIIWGREADITPLSQGRDLADEADCALVVFDETMLLPHVEYPNQFVDVAIERLAAEA